MNIFQTFSPHTRGKDKYIAKGTMDPRNYTATTYTIIEVVGFLVGKKPFKKRGNNQLEKCRFFLDFGGIFWSENTAFSENLGIFG